MHCEKFEARLQDLLDARLSPECDSELLAHADQCDACREMLVLCEQMLSGLEVWEAPPLPDDFAARVVALAQQPVTVAELPAQKEQMVSLGWKLLSGVLAASLLLGVVTMTLQRNPNASTPQGSIADAGALPAATSQAQVTINPAMMASSPTLGPRPLQPGELVQLVENADGLFDGRKTGRIIREVTSSLPEVPLVDEHVPGLRPITSSVSLTIGIVRKSLPVRRDSAPRENEKPAEPLKPQADFSRLDSVAGMA
jgi:hypothetical protein